jgi:D-alanyl-D-alanine carboxypeptidase
MQQKPYFPPGKGYHYTNTNYLLIGMIIENITKDGVGKQIRKRLLEPFGLTQTFYPETEAMPSPWVHGYHLNKQGNWEDISNTIPVAFMGSAGAMISDMNDIRRWIELYATGKDVWTRDLQRSHQLHPIPGQHLLWSGNYVQRGLVRLHWRASRLQHRGLLLAGDGPDDRCVDKLPGEGAG